MFTMKIAHVSMDDSYIVASAGMPRINGEPSKVNAAVGISSTSSYESSSRYPS
jgi:hypothetical protein